MSKFLSFIACLVASAPLFAQWAYTTAPMAGRYDDLFFLNPDTGWAAGGGDGWIVRTYDGGATWQTLYSSSNYLRSIEFATPTMGFCGSLDGTFLRTTDAGDTWQNIINLMPEAAAGVCGLDAASPERIYGVGVWYTPAYVVRTLDAGNTWDVQNVPSLATALVDVLFLNPDTGFAAGKASPVTDGGVILRTVDGGDTWQVWHTTGTPGDYVWKLQSPDGQHLYGSIEGPPGAGTRIVRSADAGQTWVTDTISADYFYLQAIGFLNPQRGWAGGNWDFLQTTDGGETWTQQALGYGYDRFQKVSATEAYMSGSNIYKYTDGSTALPPAPAARQPFERISVDPNPLADEGALTVHIHLPSPAEVELYTADGRLVRSIFRGTLAAGDHRIPVSVGDLGPGLYHAALRTNQGQVRSAFTKR